MMASEAIDEPLSVEGKLESHTGRTNENFSMVRFGSWEWDIQSNAVFWSDELYRIYGLQPQEFEATFEAYLTLVHPDDHGTVLHAIETALAQTQIFSYEVRIIQPDGEMRVIQSRGSVIVDENGKAIKLRGLSQDVTLQKQTEESLRESEERFSNAFEYAGIGMGLVDEKGCWLKVNKSLCDLLGYSADELTRLTFQEITHPDDLDADLENLRALLAGETDSYCMEKRYFHKQGHILSILLTASMVRDQENQPLHFIAQIQDVTERKQAENSLRKSEGQLRALVESIDEIVFELDERGIYVNVWASQESLLMQPKEKILGQSVIDVLGAMVGRPLVEAIQRVIATGKPENFEYELDLAIGRRCFLARLSPISSAEGSFQTACVLTHDVTEHKQAQEALQKAHDELELRVIERTAEITRAHRQLQEELAERKRAEETLRAAQQMLQLVLNNIPQAIFWKDRNSVYLGCNYRLAQDAGHASSQELIGKTDDEMPWAEHAPNYKADDRQVMETDTSKLDIEEPLTRSDGSKAWLSTNKIPLHDAQGEVIGVLCSYEDITMQKESAAAIHQARDEAERANAAKGEFLSRMSHELRTPLNAILGFGQILEMQKKQLTSSQNQGVHQILKAGRHLLNLVNEVLDITRLDAPEGTLSLEPTALNEVVREALDMMEPLAAVAGVSLPRQLVTKSPILVLADRQRLTQIMLNLLSNAIKYNNPGGWVAVSADVLPENRVQLHVSDNGHGITEENIPRLFTPFSRLGAEKLGVEGAGLGLVLCRRLAQAMNGLLLVESDHGQGSTFSLELPLAKLSTVNRSNDYILLAHKTEKPVETSVTATSLAEHTVLLIEDNISNFQLIEMILADLGNIRLLGAMQGGLGVELAQQQRPDLILLDMHLPDIMGDEVLRRLQAIPETQDVPVIILSADATPTQISRLLAQGARQYLTKPLDVKRFLQAVNETIPTR